VLSRESVGTRTGEWTDADPALAWTVVVGDNAWRGFRGAGLDKKLALDLDEEAPPSSRRHDARPETTADAHARVGQTLASKYRLDAIIGSGGMGHVYRATNTLIGRTVAIKMLRREHSSNTIIVDRFLREARTANLVQHPNIVDVTDVGTADDGVPFIVQEYLEGETLLQYAEKHKGRIPIAELIEIMGPVLSAVADAHEKNIVHRDLKPENVFLAGVRRKRVPKVLDFGISKVRGLEGEITLAGVMMGTPAYMAPELAVSSKDADPRADVWALGVIVFEMLSGQLPFDGDSVVEVLRAVTTTDAKKLSDVAPHVPAAVSKVVERCLSRDPNGRYANARELGIELARAFQQAAPAAVAQWSLRPGAGGTLPPMAMPEMPKPAKLPSESQKTTTLVMEGAPSTTSTAPLARPLPAPAPAPAPPPASAPAVVPANDLKQTAKKRKRRTVSTKAIVILGALIVIVLAELVIFLKLAG
jgi:eukaryotic-like serine/threonine-protein kinase